MLTLCALPHFLAVRTLRIAAVSCVPYLAHWRFSVEFYNLAHLITLCRRIVSLRVTHAPPHHRFVHASSAAPFSAILRRLASIFNASALHFRAMRTGRAMIGQI